jgi:hypothetical protein
LALVVIIIALIAVVLILILILILKFILILKVMSWNFAGSSGVWGTCKLTHRQTLQLLDSTSQEAV